MNNLDELSDEIALHLIKFIPIASIGHLAAISKRWQRLTNDGSIWKNRILKELTKNPVLAPGQTYKEYYQAIYQGKYVNKKYNWCITHTTPYFKIYLQRQAKEALPQFPVNIQKEETLSLEDESDSQSISGDDDYYSNMTNVNFLGGACRLGTEVWAEQLIKIGTEINFGHLQAAIDNGNFEIIALIIRNIPNNELNNQWHDTHGHYYKPRYERNVSVFHYAVESDHYKTALPLLFEDPTRITVLPELHTAAACGNVARLNELLQADANVNQKDCGKCTPLWWAIVCGHLDCVKFLLSNNAKVNDISVGKHRSALMVAIWRKNMGCLQLLLDKKAYIKETTFESNFHPVPLTALHLAAEYDFVEGLQLLVNYGFKLDKFSHNFTPLHSAAKAGSKTSVELLIQLGMDVNQKRQWIALDEDYKDDTYTNATPLFLAAQNKHFECIELLLNAGADPDLLNEHKWVPCKLSRKHDSWSITQSVLGELISAINQGYLKNRIHHELNKENYEPADPANVISFTYINCLKAVLQRSANPNIQDFEGTALDKLIKNQFSDSLLKDRKEIHYIKFVEQCIKILLEFNVNPNLPNRHGETVLHTSISKRQLNIFKLFIESGKVSISQLDEKGNTLLHLAAQYGALDIVNYLVDNGLNLSDINNNGESALSLAEKFRHQDIVDYLKSKMQPTFQNKMS